MAQNATLLQPLPPLPQSAADSAVESVTSAAVMPAAKVVTSSATARYYEAEVGRPPPSSILLTPNSPPALQWYDKVQCIVSSHPEDKVAAAKEVISQSIESQRRGHIAFTDGQHRQLTALQLGVASARSDQSVGSLLLAYQISLVTDIQSDKVDSTTAEIDQIKVDLLEDPTFAKLRDTFTATKKFTPAVCSKLVKPFAAQMDEETLKVLMERCQLNREYARTHLYEGIVTGVAQRKYCERHGQS